MNKSVKTEADSQDEFLGEREKVPLPTFLSDINGGARIFNYRFFSGVEAIGDVIGVVGIILYEVVRDPNVYIPSPTDLSAEEYKDWHRENIIKRECRFDITPADLTTILKDGVFALFRKKDQR